MTFSASDFCACNSGVFDTMAAPNIAANATNMLNVPVSIFLFIEFCSAFQKARTFSPDDALLQWLL